MSKGISEFGLNYFRAVNNIYGIGKMAAYFKDKNNRIYKEFVTKFSESIIQSVFDYWIAEAMSWLAAIWAV